MEAGDLKKIQRLYQFYVTSYGKNGKVYKRGPYWRGSGTYDGIQYTIYIGKVLPPELKKLLDRRVEIKGAKRYHWPKKVNSR